MPLLLLRFLPYLLGFLAVAGVIGGAVSYVSNHWATKAGIEKGRAELQPQLEACQAAIQRQNEAVAKLHEESARRLATSAAALRKAQDKGRVWEDNAARLREALVNRKPTETTCQQAWEKIRGKK